MITVVPTSGASVIPEPYDLAHVARTVSDQLDPDTGNNVIVQAPPVIRKAQSISQIGRLRGSSKILPDAESVKRIETELHIAVADPSSYGPLDQVLLFPDVDDDGDYVPGTGVAFWVDGVSYDSRNSPWPLFTKAFGGAVRLRRVT